MKRITISHICLIILGSMIGIVGFAPLCAMIAAAVSPVVGISIYVALNIVAITAIWRTILELD